LIIIIIHTTSNTFFPLHCFIDYSQPHVLYRLHGIRDLCKDETLQALSRNDRGLPREKISNWLFDSPIYGPWYKFMKNNMKPKSFDQNLNRALVKLRFAKRGTCGRYVHWLLPQLTDVETSSTKKVEDPVENIGDDVDVSHGDVKEPEDALDGPDTA